MERPPKKRALVRDVIVATVAYCVPILLLAYFLIADARHSQSTTQLERHGAVLLDDLLEAGFDTTDYSAAQVLDSWRPALEKATIDQRSGVAGINERGNALEKRLAAFPG